MNKGKKIMLHKPDPWDLVEVKRGKLSGGILTDELMNAAFPANNLPQSKNGLDVVRVRTEGQRVPLRSSAR